MESKILMEHMAEDIREVYELPFPVKNIEDIVKKLGGTIERADEPYLQNCYGINVVRNGNDFSIIVPKYRKIGLEEKRIIAACLGHLFVHMGYNISPKIWEKQRVGDVSEPKSLEEQLEANYLGLALLIPKKEFCEIFKKKREELNVHEKFVTGNLLKEMVDFFDVTENMIVLRGKDLDIFSENFY